MLYVYIYVCVYIYIYILITVYVGTAASLVVNRCIIKKESRKVRGFKKKDLSTVSLATLDIKERVSPGS